MHYDPYGQYDQILHLLLAFLSFFQLKVWYLIETQKVYRDPKSDVKNKLLHKNLSESIKKNFWPFLNKSIVKIIEMHQNCYFLIRPIMGILPSDENQRFRDGSTSLAYTYNTSLKPGKIRVANHTRFLSQNSKLRNIYRFFSKKLFKTTLLIKMQKESMKNWKFMPFSCWSWRLR